MALFESITLFHAFLVLGAAALLLPRGRPAAIAGEGLLAFMLGGAALQVGARAQTALTIAAAGTLEAPASFLTVSHGLLLLGPLGVLVGSVLAWRTADHGRARAVSVLGVVVALATLAVVTWLVFQSGSWTPVVAATVLAVAAVGCYRLGKATGIGTVVRYVDIHGLSRVHWHDRLAAPQKSDFVWVAILVVGAAAVLGADHLGLVVSGALAVAAAAHALAYRLWGGPRFPVLPLMVAPLIFFVIEVRELAGAAGWTMTDPALAPLTADIEIRLLPLVAIAAWGLAGLWPVHGLVPRGVLAPVGGAVLLRLGAGFLPAGLLFWQPLLSPLALASVWWGALTGRRSLLVTGWAFQALVSDFPMASRGAFFLLGVSAALALLPALPERAQGPAGRVLVGLTLVGIAWSLPAMLQTQVVYSVLAVIAVGVAVWRRREGDR